MAPITVGVPVYNGAALIDGCLASLARQTFRDFKALIFDNASTDGTSDICQAWAARDARFHYVRQPRNVGAIANFRDALLAADTPWFMWRADDDLSADNYIEVLYRLASETPGCKLAVSTCVSCDLDGGRRRATPPPDGRAFVTLRGQLAMLLDYPEGWFYGLWDADTARKSCLPVLANYPFANASEHLTLYGPIIDGAVRGTAETEILKRVRRIAGTDRSKIKYSTAQLLDMRRAFKRELRRVRSERSLSIAFRFAHLAFEPRYLRRRLPSLSKIARTRLRELLGLSGYSSRPAEQDTGAAPSGSRS
jgi:glycosyltransferase involved in cell wall biosynthesis